MKIHDQKDIWGTCAACGAEIAVINHTFTVGDPSRGQVHEYAAGLYHNREHGVNLCNAACAVKFQKKMLDKTASS